MDTQPLDEFEPTPSTNTSEPHPPPTRARTVRRDIWLALLAVGGSATLMFGVLISRSLPSSEAAAATIATPAAGAPNTSLSAGPAAWTTENRALWLGDNPKGIAFEVPAQNDVAIWMRSVRPSLVVRCVAGVAEAFVFTQSAAKLESDTEDHTITFSFDNGPETTERWVDAEEHDALFAPAGNGFVQRIASAQTMRFGFTPHNAAPASATFHVSGLAPLLETSTKECGWTK